MLPRIAGTLESSSGLDLRGVWRADCLLHASQRGEKWRGVVLSVYVNAFSFTPPQQKKFPAFVTPIVCSRPLPVKSQCVVSFIHCCVLPLWYLGRTARADRRDKFKDGCEELGALLCWGANVSLKRDYLGKVSPFSLWPGSNSLFLSPFCCSCAERSPERSPDPVVD